MDLAEPAGRVSPATVQQSKYDDDEEYKVEAAENMDELSGHDTKTGTVEPAVTVDDAKQFAPLKQLNEPHFDSSKGVSLEKLRESGLEFENEAGVCKGLQMHGMRKVTLALSKVAPSIWDARDFVSYGEISRYIAVKDDVLFVYISEKEPTFLFTVPLESLKAVRENPKKPHKRSVTVSPGYGDGVDRQDDNVVNVLLLDARDKLVYQLAFNTANDEELVDRFLAVMQHANSISKKKSEK